MGQDVDDRSFTREDRTRYRAKVRRCLDVFARMLSDRDFSVGEPQVGIEIEFNLVDRRLVEFVVVIVGGVEFHLVERGRLGVQFDLDHGRRRLDHDAG